MATSVGLLDLFPLDSFVVGNASTVALDASTDVAACVFTAPKTANLVTAKFQQTAKAGTGGAVTVALNPVDSSGNPDTATTYASGTATTSAAGEYEVTFGTPYGVTSGTDYAITIVNTDGAPSTNYPTILICGISAPGTSASQTLRSKPYGATNTGSWAKDGSGIPMISACYATNSKVLGCSQANSGSLQDFKSDSAADELALSFTVPVEMTCVALKAMLRVTSTTSNVDVVLYSGATATETFSIDGDAATASAGIITVQLSQARTLSVGTTYKIAVKPTQSTTNVRVYYTVYKTSASRLSDFPLAPYMSSRADAGSWTDYNSGTDYRVLVATPVISEVASSSGRARTFPLIRGL